MAIDQNTAIERLELDDSQFLQGAQRAIGAMEKVADGAEKMAGTVATGTASAFDKLDKAVASSQGSLNRWRARADEGERSLQMLIRAESDYNRAIKNGQSSVEEKTRVLDQLWKQTIGAADAANQNAIAMERERQSVDDAQRSFNALLGVNAAVAGSARASAAAFEDAARAEEDSARAAIQLRAANENLRATYVPMAGAQQRYAVAVEEITRAHREGVLTTGEYRMALANARGGLNSATQTAAAAQGGYKNLGMAIQQAGFQVGDFAVQVASGQGFLRPFIQQGTQLISMFGPWGAVLGAAGAVLGAVVTYLWDFGDAADAAKKAGDAYDDSISAIDDNLKRATESGKALRSGLETEASTVGDLTLHYAKLSTTMREVEAIRLTALGNQAREALAEQRTAVAGLLDSVEDAAELSRRMSEVGGQMQMGQQPDDVLRMVEALDAFKRAAPDDIEAIGRLAVALDQTAKAGGPFAEAARKAADALTDPATQAVELADKLKLVDANMAVLRGTATSSQVALLNLGDGISKTGKEAAKLAEQRVETIAGLEVELRQQTELRKAHEQGVFAIQDVTDAQDAYTIIQKLKLAADTDEAKQITALVVKINDQKRAIEGITDAQKAAEDAAKDLVREQKKAAEAAKREYEKVIDNIHDFSEEALGDSFYESLRGKAFDFAEFFETTMFRAIANVAAAAATTQIVMPIATGFVGAAPGLFGLSGQAAGMAGQTAGPGIGSIFSPITSAITNGFSQVSSYLFGTAGGAANALGVGAKIGGLTNVGTPGLFGTYGSFGASSLSGLLGGVGLGAGAGTLFNSLIGGKSTGGMIGSAAGALIGTMLMPGLGSVLGGLLGGAAGGLFGPGKTVGPTGVARLPHVIGDSNILLTTDNGGNSDQVEAVAKQIRDVSTAAAEALNAFGSHGFGLDIGGFEKGFNLKEIFNGVMAGKDAFKGLTAEEAVTEGVRLTLQKAFDGFDKDEVSTALSKSTAKTIEDLLKDLDFANLLGVFADGGMDAVKEMQKPLTAVEQAFKDLAKAAEEGREKAEDLGLSVQVATDYFAGLRSELAANLQENLRARENALTGLGGVNAINTLLDQREIDRRDLIAAGTPDTPPGVTPMPVLVDTTQADTLFDLALREAFSGSSIADLERILASNQVVDANAQSAMRSLIEELSRDADTAATTAATAASLAQFNAAVAASTATIDAEISAREQSTDALRRAIDTLQQGRIARAISPEVSPFDPQERLRIAMEEFERVSDAAAGGDLGAVERFNATADAALNAALAAFGRSDQRYQAIFSQVQADSLQVESIAVQQLQVEQQQLAVLEGILAGLGGPAAQDLGYNPTRNSILASLTGYGGDFGAGGFQQFLATANLPQSILDQVNSVASSVNFAMGGVMTSRGALPLNRYAGGGIADTPQLAMFGEGRMPEAYVPLPDGRSIPVTVKMTGAANDTYGPKMLALMGRLVEQNDALIRIVGAGNEELAEETRATKQAFVRLSKDLTRAA